MSYTAVREFTPYDGKDAVLEARLKRAVGAMGKHGANSMLFKVIIGDRSGDYEIYNWYETVGAGARAMKGFMSDPEMIAVNAERAADPVAEMRGPWVGRVIHNNTKGDGVGGGGAGPGGAGGGGGAALQKPLQLIVE